MKNTMFSVKEGMDYSATTGKIFGSSKFFLFFMSIMASVSDLALLIVFAVAGHGGLAVPIILFVLDLLFIVSIIFTNFRFKYAISVWTVYIVLSAVTTAFLAMLDSGAEVYSTALAKALNVISHVAFYGVLIFACIYPILKKSIKVKAAMIACVAFALVAMVGFAFTFSTIGYFGQGFVGGYRVVGYTLSDDGDTYIATSIKKGHGNKVIIPEEFDGKKVTGVSCSIFTQDSIRSVEIESKEKIQFVDTELLDDVNPNLKVGVDKQFIDTYRKDFFGRYSSSDTSWLTLSNNLYPLNLDKNEIYLTFAYDECPEQSDMLSTWIGKKGDVFRLQDVSSEEYVRHVDANSVSDLVWCFENNDAKMLTGAILENNGVKINDSGKIDIDFQNIYKIRITDSNDSIYNISDKFKELRTTSSDGAVYDGYRFVTLASADDLLKEFDREGFDLGWGYVGANDNVYDLDSLSEIAASLNTNTISISPRWDLQEPKNLAINFVGKTGDYVYGDDVNMEVVAVAPNSDCVMSYSWTYEGDGSNLGKTGVSYSITNALPQDGTFTVRVDVVCSTSSLTKSVAVWADLSVHKKALNITWTHPTSMVYNAEAKVMQFSSIDLINGDTLTGNVIQSGVTNTNAGQYTARISLVGDLADRYEIASGSSYNYTISRRVVQTQWSYDEAIYDGELHNAVATATGVNSMSLTLSLTEAKKNAGRYTAVASCSDTNYELTNTTYEFEIKQKSVTVVWGNSDFVYNGYAQYPTVSTINGLVSGENVNSQLSYSGYSSNINAGDGYTVRVTLPSSSNYKFDTVQQKEYNIDKKPLSLRTIAEDKTYDGRVNSFDFEVVSGLLNMHTKASLGTPSYTGDGASATDVGNYSVNAAFTENSVNKNYDIVCENATFDINKRALRIRATASNKTYDGNANTFDFDVVSGLVSVHTKASLGVPSYTGTGVGAVNAGSYSVAVSFVENNVTKNYDITYTNATFNITRRNARVRTLANNKTYDGNVNTFDFEVVSGLLSIHNKASLGTPSYSGNGSSAVDVGSSYEVKAVFTENDVLKNYSLSVDTASFSISKRALSLRTLASNKTYDGSKNTFDFEVVSGLISAHTKASLGTPTYSGTGANATGAGNYSVNASFVENSVTKNYSITCEVATFTIEKRDLQVRVLASDKTYDGNKNTFDFEVVSGLISAHTKASLGTPSYSGTGANAVNVGDDYSVTVSFAENSVTKNYNITCENATFSITKAQIALVWSTGADGVPSVAVSGQVYSGDITITRYIYKDSTGETLDSKPTESGTYTVEAVVEGKNYLFTNKVISFTIAETEEEVAA